MRKLTLPARSLAYYRLTHVAGVLAVASAATILAGSLVVGDSMRASLRANAVARLGPVDHALVGRHFFTQALAERIAADPQFRHDSGQLCPAIMTVGNLEQPGSGARANRASIIGVNEQSAGFWNSSAMLVPSDRSMVVNRTLADRLGIRTGLDVLVRIPRDDRVPPETLLGRRDRSHVSMRLTVSGILADDGPGGFSSSPAVGKPLNAYVSLAALQRALHRPEHINTLLVGHVQPGELFEHTGPLNGLVEAHATLADYGLELSDSWIQSSTLFIPPAVEDAVVRTAQSAGTDTTRAIIYLANSIAGESTEVPYSVVAAVDSGLAGPPLAEDEIVLTDWTAEQLHARVGDRASLTYYRAGDFGRLTTEAAQFRVRAIISLAEAGRFRRSVPAYEGITDAKRISDWDPPFPLDLKRIRPQDEAYWEQHGPTPKAFISLQAGRRLWTQHTRQYGEITSIELRPRGPATQPQDVTRFAEMLLGNLSPEMAGLSFQPVRSQALQAAEGSTDFGMLFVAFSFFLMIAAVLLIALVFRLHLERRSPEIGILLANGFAPRTIGRLLLVEGLVLAVIGSAVGMLASIAYAQAMLDLLRALWPPQMSGIPLHVQVSPPSLAIGFVASVLVATMAITFGVRSMTRISAASLLAGTARSGRPAGRARSRKSSMIGMGALALAALLASGAHLHWLSAPAGFFGSGAALLVACIAAARYWLVSGRVSENAANASAPMIRLGIRNASRHPGRSTLTIALVASATFIVVAVGANRREHGRDASDRHGGTGGFSLVAESTIPILQPIAADSSDTHVFACRMRPGDDASCLNLYRPQRPRIVGVPESFIQRGGFAFASSLNGNPEEKANPWLLLNRSFADGAVPAIADESTVMWLLKSGLGRDLVVTDERGKAVPLRFVALLAGSMLQSEIVIAEQPFKQLFPSIAGYGFFLIDVNPEHSTQVARRLERDFSDNGLVARPAIERLSAYSAVENTYLAAFQLLGGLGLVLGTIGLAAVLARNVLEQRRELALLEAVGYRRGQIRTMLLAENLALLLVGLFGGTVSALIAVLPNLRTGASGAIWGELVGIVAVIIAAGALTGVAAVRFALRGTLTRALRSE